MGEPQGNDDWIYPQLKHTEKQRRQIIGPVAEIGTRVVLENFCYKFGGVAYHQQGGGPIGARVTMCAAKMVMQSWARKYHGILLRAGLRIPLITGYVDDGRQGGTVLRRGMRFCEHAGEFVMDDEQLKQDEEENEPDNVRMAKRCLRAMNSVNADLRFTTAAPEDFKKKRLTTLDFMIWMVEGKLYHSYYEKEMKTQYTVMQRSAMSEHQKMAILSNELVRRLSNIHKDVLKEETEGVIEQYISQLKNSGFSRKQAKEIIVCGMVGWRKKLDRRELAGQKQSLEAKDTLEKRTDDKLLKKTNWYKGNKKRKLENKNSKFKCNPPAKQRKKGQQEESKEGPGGKKAVKAVMFVPFSAHSELATRLSGNEEKMEGMPGYRLKIVEKGGTKLVDLLHKANPWAGQDCGRVGCLLGKI
jgi:hypothetical protein